MLHQQEIERRVSQRWGDVSAASASWAGHYLPTIEVRAPAPCTALGPRAFGHDNRTDVVLFEIP
jgi:hypothetical protein